jgi:predicted nucleic acid-binding protein
VILVDTSVWIDHFRSGSATLSSLLDSGEVLSHPFVIGELALGSLRRREFILDALQTLPRAETASDDEVLQFVEHHSLAGKGIGYVDAHLLAAVQLTLGALLWTRDRRLLAVADRLGLGVEFMR